jgi:hypothetical protein
MELADLKKRLDALPDGAQGEVADLIAALEARYSTARSSAAGLAATTSPTVPLGYGAPASMSGDHRMADVHLFDTDVLIDAIKQGEVLWPTT